MTKPEFDTNFTRHLSAVSRRARGGYWTAQRPLPTDNECYPITSDSGELIGYIFGKRNAELVTEYRNVMPRLLKYLRAAQRAAGINAARWGRTRLIALREGVRISHEEMMSRTPVLTREQGIALFGDKNAPPRAAMPEGEGETP